MDLVREQRLRNAQAAETWDLYESHRRRVTQHLCDAAGTHVAAPNSARLCLLGAGQCNDLDLRRLLDSFHEIVLLDVDSEALRSGLDRQGLTSEGRIEVVAPCDVTGAFEELQAIKSASEEDTFAVDRCLAVLQQLPTLPLTGGFDVVASVGLLTQLVDAVVACVGESHPRFWKVVSAIRAQHVRLMLSLTQPGGRMLLITEVVSSDSCPDLCQTSESQLNELLLRGVSAGNFFTGTNPAAMCRFLQTDPSIAEQLAELRILDPWLWNFWARTYAVSGLRAQKRSGSELSRRNLN